MPFYIVSSQLAVVFSAKAKSSLDLWLRATKLPFSTEFTETVQMQTLPDDSQFDAISGVNLLSSDKRTRLTLARTRADLFVDGKWHTTYAENREEIHDKFEKFTRTIQGILEMEGLFIKNIGFVNNFFVPDSEANKKISKLLITSPMSLQGGQIISNCGLRIETIDEINGRKINSISRLEKAEVGNNISKKSEEGILLQRDFNDFADNKNSNLSWNEIAQFISTAAERFNLENYENQLNRND